MRRLAITLAALAAAMVAVAMAARFAVPAQARVRPGVVSGDDVAGLAYSLLGALLVVKRPRLRVGWLMLAGGFLTAMLGPAQAAFDWISYRGDPADLHVVLYVTNAVGALAILSVDLLLPLLYPDGRPPSRRWLPVAVLVSAFMVIQSVAFIGRRTPPGSRLGPNPLETSWAAPVWDAVIATPVNQFVIAEALCLLSLVARFLAADAERRRQIGWLLYAVAANLLVEHWAPFSVLSMITTAAIPAAIVVAIMRYRLYGIDTLVSRTLIAAGLVGLLSAAYFGAVTLSSLLTSGRHPIAGVAAALIAGACFQPLRRHLRRLLDRLFYGTAGDVRLLTERLERQARSADPASALPAAAETLREGLAVTGVAVHLPGVPGGRVEAGHVGERCREVPLVWHGEEVGRLLIGPPEARRFPAAHDERVIAALRPGIADIAHAVRLTADLQRSRRRILTTREEERRRLRRDLHDGLGQSLGGLAMSINAARLSLRSAPDAAERLLAELGTSMADVTDDIKTLVYGLRPPALDDLGLAGAVRALAGESAVPEVGVSVEGDLAGLPAAVEVAAYRIAQEALTNVRRHAGARTCQITLRRGERLRIVVADDGAGLPADVRAGVGTRSMRERAAELGGTCTISSPPEGGTVVEALL
ncbi:sensor histidine kinase [Nonomuraea sp. NN258]|uniref:sensor histidine kinase n=1 Tax=Nonomuraea antri TaxID=2730852 RepID=UPI00156A2152|nr:sensor histidine kinase [Nonomuraea antri]NRQ33396.1 sensor histidine kinase [Nonomuraea antri]